MPRLVALSVAAVLVATGCTLVLERSRPELWDGDADGDSDVDSDSDSDGDGDSDTDVDGDAGCDENGDCDDGVACTVDRCDEETDECVHTSPDADGDGYGDAACEGGDCDDTDPAFHPGAPEGDCTDPNDYNCDGSVGFVDTDDDGFAACEECNDADPSVNPDAVETCNGVDDDCDGETDEGTNACGGVCSLSNAPGAACDGSDTDLCLDDAYECDGMNATVCSVGDDDVEVCDGRVDEDCDGRVDEDCSCTNGATLPCGTDVGECVVGTQTCRGGRWSDCEDGIGPTDEVCNGADDDCDGETDEGCFCTLDDCVVAPEEIPALGDGLVAFFCISSGRIPEEVAFWLMIEGVDSGLSQRSECNAVGCRTFCVLPSPTPESGRYWLRARVTRPPGSEIVWSCDSGVAPFGDPRVWWEGEELPVSREPAETGTACNHIVTPPSP